MSFSQISTELEGCVCVCTEFLSIHVLGRQHMKSIYTAPKSPNQRGIITTGNRVSRRTEFSPTNVESLCVFKPPWANIKPQSHSWQIPRLMENYSPCCESQHKAVTVQSTVVRSSFRCQQHWVPPGHSLLKERRFFNEACHLSVEDAKLWTINTVTKAGSSTSSEIVMSSGRAAPLSERIRNSWEINICQWDPQTEGCQGSKCSSEL